VPIFWGHGVNDPLVPLPIGRLSKEELKNAGVKEAKESGEPGIFFKEYPGLAHSVDVGEIKDWANWLKKVIPPP
jgi:predicted esterase